MNSVLELCLCWVSFRAGFGLHRAPIGGFKRKRRSGCNRCSDVGGASDTDELWCIDSSPAFIEEVAHAKEEFHSLIYVVFG